MVHIVNHGKRNTSVQETFLWMCCCLHDCKMLWIEIWTCAHKKIQQQILDWSKQKGTRWISKASSWKPRFQLDSANCDEWWTRTHNLCPNAWQIPQQNPEDHRMPMREFAKSCLTLYTHIPVQGFCYWSRCICCAQPHGIVRISFRCFLIFSDWVKCGWTRLSALMLVVSWLVSQCFLFWEVTARPFHVTDVEV